MCCLGGGVERYLVLVVRRDPALVSLEQIVAHGDDIIDGQLGDRVGSCEVVVKVTSNLSETYPNGHKNKFTPVTSCINL